MIHKTTNNCIIYYYLRRKNSMIYKNMNCGESGRTQRERSDRNSATKACIRIKSEGCPRWINTPRWQEGLESPQAERVELAELHAAFLGTCRAACCFPSKDKMLALLFYA